VYSRRVSVVIDTSVWISGLLTKAGSPAQLVRRVINLGQPVFTTDTFAELKERLWHPKFDRYVGMEQRKQLLHDIDTVAYWVDVSPELAGQTFSRDKYDDKFIHAAFAADAHWLVTGDKDLLVLSGSLLPSGLRIVTPADILPLPEFLQPR
jgi:putative PIN family toxin of toxin-antitoxin system